MRPFVLSPEWRVMSCAVVDGDIFLVVDHIHAESGIRWRRLYVRKFGSTHYGLLEQWPVILPLKGTIS